MSYKDSLNLPKTNYPQWVEQAEFEQEAANNGFHLLKPVESYKGRYVLHGGPPFANGPLHVGHLLNVTLKDFVVRTKSILGYDVDFTLGWDCHGLPLEQAVVKDDPTLRQDPAKLRAACRQKATEFVDLQREQLSTLGLLHPLSSYYKTMDSNYEADQMMVFSRFQEKGLVYSSLRPTLWSYGCQTALADAEVEYKIHKTTCAYVLLKSSLLNTYLMVWTTQPWTLLSNQAVAFNPKFTYKSYPLWDGKSVVVLESLAENLGLYDGVDVDLNGVTYTQPFDEGCRSVVPSDFVSNEDGTGLVHLAPAHGPDDYKVGMQYGLSLDHYVNERGEFTKNCPLYTVVGMNVFKANSNVINALLAKELLYKENELVHRYPFCWRSNTPLLYRSTKQWFVKLDDIKESAMKLSDDVEYFPEWGKTRLQSSLYNRPDWCVSRQRAWGLPLPVFYTPEGDVVQSADLTRNVSELFRYMGSKVWYEMDNKVLCALLGLPDNLVRGTDTLDVWLDSGSSCHSVLRGERADLYLEGTDQHRGWFQSSLYVSTILYNQAPYKALLTHGFVLDKQKDKIAKSKGGSAVDAYVKKYGVEVLKLWVAGQTPTDDVVFDEEQLKQSKETLRVFRNTLKILLANCNPMELDREHQPEGKKYPLSEWDHAFLVQLNNLKSNVLTEYDQFNFPKALNLIVHFCKEDLSARYLESVKDTLYCDKNPKEVRHVLRTTLKTLATLLWPLIPFTAGEALQHGNMKLEFLIPTEVLENSLWNEMEKLRNEVNLQAEQLRGQGLVGKSTELSAKVYNNVTKLKNLADVLGVSEVTFGDNLFVTKHNGNKCPRCWKFHHEEKELCCRCESVLVV